jgi:hypothetical protein
MTPSRYLGRASVDGAGDVSSEGRGVSATAHLRGCAVAAARTRENRGTGSSSASFRIGPMRR